MRKKAPRKIVTSSRTDWLAARTQGIGGSDAATVVGANPWSDPTTLWMEKTGMRSPQAENEAMWWGNQLEAIVAQRHAMVTGRPIESPAPPGKFLIHQHPTQDFALATLDFLQVDDQRGPGILEIKTTGSPKINADEWMEDPPLHYQIQLQHQLMVTGMEWGSLSVLIRGNQFATCDIARNEDFCQLLLAKEKEFWQMVLDGQMPAFDGSVSSVEAIHHLYPVQTAGKVIQLSDEFRDLAEELEQVTEERKELEKREEEIKARVKAELGDAERGIIPGGGFWNFKLVESKEYVVPAKSYRKLTRTKK